MMTRLLLAALAAWVVQDDWAEFAKLSKDRDPDARCKAIRLIDKCRDLRAAQALAPMAGDDHARVRARAIRALEQINDPPAVEWLARGGMAYGSDLIRAGVAEALGAHRGPEAEAALTKALADGSPAVRESAARSLADLGSIPALETLVHLVRKDAYPRVRAAAFEAVARIDPALAGNHDMEPDQDRAYEVRLVAAEAAAKLPADRARAILSRLVADDDWRVRAAVIETCSALGTREAVGLLVDRLQHEKGRLQADALAALARATGESLGGDPRAWKAWWDAQKDKYEPRPASGPPAAGATPAVHESGPVFFSIPITSTRISFILDLSGSMRDPAAEKRSNLTKLDVAKAEMVQTIRALGRDTAANIILLGADKEGNYNKTNKIWKPSLTAVTPASQQEAVAFVNRQEAWGWTNIYDALALAFEDEAVDTVFLYSDGGASKGVFVTTEEILTTVGRLNHFRKIRIHTVEVPGEKANTQDNLRLLKGLAQITGGTYRGTEPKEKK